MTRPRVVFVTDQMQDPRLLGGFADTFDLTVLVPESRRATVTTPGASAPPRVESVRGGRGGFAFRGARWLSQHRDEHDLVIAQDNLTAALAANLAALRTRRPVVLRLGRTTVEYFRCRADRGPRYWAGLALVKALVAFNEWRATAIGASSHYIAGSCRRARLARVTAAYGVDPEVFRPEPRRAEARRLLRLPRHAPLVLCRSRIAPEKDPETFLLAMRKLRDIGRDAVALYVGAEHAGFAALAARHGVPVIARDHVHPRRELPLYYRAADVVVQTSRAEGFGISPLEALACETPVVATATGGLAETIRDGETGLTARPGDAQGVAGAVARLLGNPDLATAMARRGRAMVLQRYTSAHAFEAWRALAEEVAGGALAAPVPAYTEEEIA